MGCNPGPRDCGACRNGGIGRHASLRGWSRSYGVQVQVLFPAPCIARGRQARNERRAGPRGAVGIDGPRPLARRWPLRRWDRSGTSGCGRAAHRKGDNSVAGWSSPVARRAHNPKVAGSNPAPATITSRFVDPYGFAHLGRIGCRGGRRFSVVDDKSQDLAALRRENAELKRRLAVAERLIVVLREIPVGKAHSLPPAQEAEMADGTARAGRKKSVRRADASRHDGAAQGEGKGPGAG
jgi:hypothetical protein